MLLLDEDNDTECMLVSDTLMAGEHTAPTTYLEGEHISPAFSYDVKKSKLSDPVVTFKERDEINSVESGSQVASDSGFILPCPQPLILTPPILINKIDMECFSVFSGPDSSVLSWGEWENTVVEGEHGEVALGVEHAVGDPKPHRPHIGRKQGKKFLDVESSLGGVPARDEGSSTPRRSNSLRPPTSIPKIKVWSPPMAGLEEHSFPTLATEVLVVEVPSVIYDEESQCYELFHAETDKEKPTPPMAVDGLLGGFPAHILAPDSGCNTQVVSESFCKSHGIPTYLLSQELGIKYSNGTTETGVRRTADLVLFVQNFRVTVRLNVVKEIAGYDVILGTPFFIKHKAILDFSLNPRRVTFTSPPGEWFYDNCFGAAEVNYIDVLPIGEQSSFLAQAKAAQSQVYLIDIRELMSVEKVPEGAEAPVAEESPRHMSDDPEQQAVFEKYMKKGLFVDKPPQTLPPDRDLPSGGSHRIQMKPGAEVPNFRGYRMSHGETIILNQKIKELADSGYIGPSMSEYGAPALLVAKPNGNGYRLVIDYRALNAGTVPKSMVPPDIRQLFDTLRNCEMFSVCDMFNGYYAMPIDPESRHRTAFVAPGLDGKSQKWEWRVLPLGLNNSPASFQTLMDEILRPVGAFVTAYLDDLIIFTRKGQNHAEVLELVFFVLDKQQIKLNINKCFLGKPKVKFLGFQLSKNLISPDPAKTEAINLYPEPTNLKELRRFIGMANYLYSFVEKFSNVCAPLVALVTKAEKAGSKGIVWSESAQKAFDALKAAIVAAPGLMIPDLNIPFQVSADSCGLGMGGSLWQVSAETGLMTPIAFISQKYTEAVMNYSIQERELYASVLCFKKWHHYLALAAHPTLIISDHESLQSFVTHKDLHQGGQGRRPRWAEFLGKFRFIQQYHSGASPVLATPDAISRVFENPAALPSEPMGSNCDLEINFFNSFNCDLEIDSIHTPVQDMAEIAVSIKSDTEYAPLFENFNLSVARLDQDWLMTIVQFLQKDKLTARLLNILDSPASEVSKHDRSFAKRYSLIDGLLYFNDERGTRLVIPETPGLYHRAALIQESHDTNLNGHFSVEKTYKELSRHFYWPSQYSDVVQYVSRCDRCLRDKHSTAKPLGLLSAYPSEELYPFHTWSIDEIVDLPVSKTGHSALLVCTERVIGTVVLIPTKKTNTAVQDALQYYLKVVCRYGMTHEIHSDRLPKYTSVFWVTLFKLAGTKLRFSTAHYKATQGQAERRNQTVETLFRHMITNDNMLEWENICPVVEFQVNNAEYKSTGVAPNESMFGRILDTPLVWLSTAESRKVMVPAVREFAEKQAALFQRCKDALRAASDSQLDKLNAKRRAHTFAVGDQVLLRASHINHVHRPHKYTKFLAPYMGYSETEPFTIVEVVSESVMKLKLPPSMVRARVFDEFPVKYLKLYPKAEPSELAHPVVEEPPAAVPVEDVPAVTIPDGFFVVEKILKAEMVSGQARYLLKFLGYPESDNQWVPRKSLTTLAKAEADISFPEFAPKVKKVKEAKAVPVEPVLVIPARVSGRVPKAPAKLDL